MIIVDNWCKTCDGTFYTKVSELVTCCPYCTSDDTHERGIIA